MEIDKEQSGPPAREPGPAAGQPAASGSSIAGQPQENGQPRRLAAPEAPGIASAGDDPPACHDDQGERAQPMAAVPRLSAGARPAAEGKPAPERGLGDFTTTAGVLRLVPLALLIGALGAGV